MSVGSKVPTVWNFDENGPHPVICLLEEQKEVEDKGASMRLGTWEAKLKKGSLANRLYGTLEVSERHRHRYEFNQDYREQMEGAGFSISGSSPDGTLCEIVEIPHHPFYLAVQFHPEFSKQANCAPPFVQRFCKGRHGRKG